MKNFRSTPLEVKQAHAEWVNTMTRVYSDFNAKMWSKNSAYRFARPQPIVKG